MRDFRVREANKNKDHKTSRMCDNKECNGQLHDSIINFGESLNKDILRGAFDLAKEADLMVSLGSSLGVSPANQMPVNMTFNGGKFVIINLQKTPIDDFAELIIHARIQTVM